MPKDKTVDINCDMGEGFGRWRLGDDEALFPLISSANVACGFHAGDPMTMFATVRGAVANGLAIGAHPGLPDLLGFGRRRIAVSPEELYAYIVTQIGALRGVLSACGSEMTHAKLHGALTLVVERSDEHGAAAAGAIRDAAPEPRVYWRAAPTPDSFSAACDRVGVEVVRELYPDLIYAPGGSVAPPAPGEFVQLSDSLEQARRAFADGQVMTTARELMSIDFDSICVHSDGPFAVGLASGLREIAHDHGFGVASPGAHEGSMA